MRSRAYAGHESCLVAELAKERIRRVGKGEVEGRKAHRSLGGSCSDISRSIR
jgi:hypothetical protein